MFIHLSNSGGRAASAGEASTGAPGDGNTLCSTCHFGGNFGTSLEIQLLDDGNLVTEYVPGESYTVLAKVNTTTAPVGYGLQLVSLIDATETDTDGLSNPSSNAQVTPLGGRKYLEQKGLSGSESFSAEWTAPAVGSGSVTFYASGHAANGNGSSSGDHAGKTSFTVTESVSTNTNEDLLTFGIQILPNPTVDFINIDWIEQSKVSLQIFSASGSLVFTKIVNQDSYTFDVSNLKSGVYYVKMTNLSNSSTEVKKFIKL